MWSRDRDQSSSKKKNHGSFCGKIKNKIGKNQISKKK